MMSMHSITKITFHKLIICLFASYSEKKTLFINLKRKKLKISLLTIIFPFALIAQIPLSQEQIWEDFTIFKNVLTKSHPSLYEYTTKKQWDSIFKNFEKERKQLKSSNDLFKSISAIGANVKDGHLRVLHPKMETVPPMFPLLLKIIGNRFYTDTDDFDIPVGSEVISINGIESKELIRRFLKYAPSDGNNSTKKYRQIESEFGILHYYEFGEMSSYTISYLTPDNKAETINIQSQPFQSIGARFPNRNSYFSKYHKHKDRFEHFKNTISQKWPVVHFVDSLNTAILTVNSFGLDPKEFKSKLIEIFGEIKREKTESLIIDIRHNNGGYRANAIILFSFITDQPFKQRVSESTVTSRLIEQNYVKHTPSDYPEFFKNYFANSDKKNDHWVLTIDRAQEAMEPYKKQFKGKTYVLIGGNTFSAGNAFVLNAKNSLDITVIGEETGGGYYFHTGQFSVLYELPNSKIMFNISLVKINHFVIDNRVEKGSGILPDVEINLTQDDLINGVDTQLDYILKRIVKQ